MQHKSVSRFARTAIAMVMTTAMVFCAAGVTLANIADAATKTYAATGELNIRSGPSTSTDILYTLKKGDLVQATGKAANNWLPIKFAGGSAYVYAQFVKAKTSTDPVRTDVAGAKVTTVNVNLRDKASLSSKIIKVLPKGTEVSATGRTSGEFSEVTVSGKIRWLYTSYLGRPITGADPGASEAITPAEPLPAVVGEATANAALALRAEASVTSASQGTVPKGAVVQLTGQHLAQYSQAVYNGVAGWILTGFYTTAVAALPTSGAKRYINATNVNLRAGADVESEKIAVLAYGTLLVTTKLAQNNYTQVIWSGQLRWVSTQYLSATAPAAGDLGSASLNKLEKYGKAAVVEIREAFPEITSIGGWRSSSAYSSDHPNGRAIDIMIPNYKSNKALGDKIAAWVIANGERLHVTYLIWYQRNWRISRGSWTKMADRGSDNQNHKNHVHVSFYPS
ncbi:MAG: SH3 domain-containing protein [Propionibacteriaceae bacterium]|jgi:uncharacterized protein YgiM (DUF1202 family)|nr:SH3 domain-containing protein [Propionibacteriaceae bacterium]